MFTPGVMTFVRRSVSTGSSIVPTTICRVSSEPFMLSMAKPKPWFWMAAVSLAVPAAAMLSPMALKPSAPAFAIALAARIASAPKMVLNASRRSSSERSAVAV